MPDNTPAPTRRFLPPSSSSAARSNAPHSTRRNPFGSAQSSQLPPPSPFSTATPRFQQSTPRIADEIQTSFDEDGDTPLPRRGLSSRTNIDAVDDEAPSSPLYSRIIEREVLNRRHADDESSPLQHRQKSSTHASKRRKVSHPASEAISVSSPPDDAELDVQDQQPNDESDGSQSELDDLRDVAPRRTENDESNRVARFRPMASDVASDSPVPRTIFRPNLEDPSPGQNPSGPALPDIFSPSRRKGKRTYVAGGSAELVRSWVLAIPAQESHGEKLAEETVVVVDVRNDSSGRFATVTDNTGFCWLLPEQQDQVGGNSRRSLASLAPGVKVLVKGQATRWSLNLYPQQPSGLTVAAYWEVADSG